MNFGAFTTHIKSELSYQFRMELIRKMRLNMELGLPINAMKFDCITVYNFTSKGFEIKDCDCHGPITWEEFEELCKVRGV